MDKLKSIIKGLMKNEKIKTLARTIRVSKNTIKVYRNLFEGIIQNNPAIKKN
jgi:hypothetical protein